MSKLQIIFHVIFISLASTCAVRKTRKALVNDSIAVPSNTKFFFHWGKLSTNFNIPGPNVDLLREGGYDFRNRPHHGYDTYNDVSSVPQNAIVTEHLLNSTARAWYSGSDAAGPGIYISANPWSSKSYGNDVLIFKLSKTDGKPLDIAYDNQSTAARDALRTRNWTNIPFVVLYNRNDFWHVLYKQPPAGVLAEFSPPNAKILDEYWQEQLALNQQSTSSVIDLIFNLTKYDGCSTSGECSDGTKAFFRTLIFDRGFQYLKSQNDLCAVRNAATKMKLIAEFFIREIPIDKDFDGKRVFMTDLMKRCRL